MRITVSRSFVFAFASAMGFSGAAMAKPDGPLPWHRDGGAPPPGVIRADIAIRAAHDGRADSSDGARARRDNAFTTPAQARPDGRMEPAKPFALPLKGEIRNRVNLCDCNSESHDAAAHRTDSGGHRERGGANTYSAPGHIAPIQIKSSIALRLLEAREEEAAAIGAKRDDHRAANKGKTRIGDAPQSELLDPKTYPHASQKVMTPAQMFSRVALHRGGGDQSDEK